MYSHDLEDYVMTAAGFIQIQDDVSILSPEEAAELKRLREQDQAEEAAMDASKKTGNASHQTGNFYNP